jgi:hypothetical protein
MNPLQVVGFVNAARAIDPAVEWRVVADAPAER